MNEPDSNLIVLASHPALEAVKRATEGTHFEGDLFVVGGAVRDALLGSLVTNDFDLVTTGSAIELAHLLWKRCASPFPPVTFERFGTAMVSVLGAQIEIVTARHDSYQEASRKPEVRPAGILDDARRRDFTVNTLLLGVHDNALHDPLGVGMKDLQTRVLRTPLDPSSTFFDDPLRMLRAVRFRHKLGFEPADDLYPAIRATRERLGIVSSERIRDEFLKILALPRAPEACADLMDLGLFDIFIPEFRAMQNCEQGSYHHLDVWEHSLLVLRNVGVEDPILSLAALFHDIGKPSTRFIDENGNTRFFGHEAVGAAMTTTILTRLCFPQREVREVAALVKNHMRLGSSPVFSPSAARRLVRDLDQSVDRLLSLVEADASSLRPGVRMLDLAPIRAQIAQTRQLTPPETLQSPLSGSEIMATLGCEPGPEVGQWKKWLSEQVVEGRLGAADKDAARLLLLAQQQIQRV